MSLDLDIAAVEAWMAEALPQIKGPLHATKFGGGQSNPTYRLDSPGKSYVLRRKPPGVLLKSAHAVEREFRVQKALAGTDVPVAVMHALCEDEAVIGSAFYIMDAVEGRTFDDPALPGVSTNERSQMMAAMCRTLAAIHTVNPNAVGLADFGPEGNYYQRQLDRWSQQYRATQTEDLPDMEALMDWLGQNMPADDGQRRLVHGDYRLDNLLFAPDAPQIVAVLDWELSTLGHPYADLAAVIMQWGMPNTADGRGLAGVHRDRLGLWPDQRFIDSYCQHRGLSGIDRFEFYLAFCHFRMAAILQGVKKRALDGNASDPARGLQLGAFVPQFARQGLEATAR